MAYDADAQAYFTAVETAKGGSFDPIYAGAIDQLIKDLKAAGIWAKLDFLFVFRNESQQAARIDVKNPSNSLTEVGSVSWSKAGYAGNGIDAYLNSGYTPSTDAVNMLQNSASFGMRIADGQAFNGRSGGRYIGFRWDSVASQFMWSASLYGEDQYVGYNQTGGLFMVNRDGLNSSALFKNGVSVSTDVTASDGMGSQALGFLASNYGAGYSTFSTNTVEVGFAGADLSAEAASFNTALNNYFVTAETPALSGNVTLSGVARPNSKVGIVSMTDLDWSNAALVEIATTDANGAFVMAAAYDPTKIYVVFSMDHVESENGTASGPGSGNNTLADTSKAWTVDIFSDQKSVCWITGGTGQGQHRIITGNTATELNLAYDWGTPPDNTSTYSIVVPNSDTSKIKYTTG